jgi:hypothetical protein
LSSRPERSVAEGPALAFLPVLTQTLQTAHKSTTIRWAGFDVVPN